MRKIYFFCILSILSFSACSWIQEEIPVTLNDPLVEAEADKRLHSYINRKLQKCREDVLDKAVSHVDSIITGIITDYDKDTLFFPFRPMRPAFPEKMELDSSLSPTPIIDTFPISPPTRAKPKQNIVPTPKDTFHQDSIFGNIISTDTLGTDTMMN